MVIGNHVLVSPGNDLDAPGFLQAFDPETGELAVALVCRHLRTRATPVWSRGRLSMRPDTAAGTCGSQGSYDPETQLYIVGTGNPTPAYTSQTRGEGDNLYTCSLVAINVETGKLAWHFSDLAARHARLGLDSDAGPD